MSKTDKIIAWMSLVALVLLGACAPDDVPGCRNDLDCRADRICQSGLCQDAQQQDNNNTPDNNGRVPDDNNGVNPLDMGRDLAQPDEGVADVALPDIGLEDVSEDLVAPEDLPVIPEDMEVLDEGLPDLGEPDTGEPDVSMPDSGEPDLEEPDTGEPDVGEPDLGEPDMEEDTGEPDMPELPQQPVLLTSVEGVDFGQVGLLVTAVAEVELRNGGQEELRLENIALNEPESRGFRAFVPALPVTLASGEVARVQVVFQPTVLAFGQPTAYGNALVIQSNDPERLEVSLPLSGVATPSPEECITFGLREVNFGQVRPGNVVNSSLELINCGSGAVDVDAIVLEGDLEGVSIVNDSPTPFLLMPGQRQTLSVRYAPMELEALRGVLRAEAGSLVALAQVRSQVREEPGLRVRVQWDNGADVDLHLVRADEDDEDFGPFGNGDGVEEDDCYWNNLNPDWGDVDAQDPVHEGDIRQGPGEEVIVLEQRQRGDRYRIGALFVRSQNINTVNATVTVELGDVTQTLTREWNRQRYWVPFVIEADGSITTINELVDN